MKHGTQTTPDDRQPTRAEMHEARRRSALRLSNSLWKELITLGLSNAAWHVEQAKKQVEALTKVNQ